MSSFLKTVALLGATLLATLAVTVVGVVAIAGPAGMLLASAGTVMSLVILVATAGGFVVLWREARRMRGQTDLILEYTSRRRELGLEGPSGFRAGIVRRWFARRILGHDFLVGDAVRIRALPEILATLDAQGSLEGMPFQPEMIKFCGREARVFRSLDKIYDYGRTKRMRRLDGCVLLSNLRCDGSAHGGCEATCYLIWKAAWLEPAGAPMIELASPANDNGAQTLQALSRAACDDGSLRCQFTELHACTSEFARRSPRMDLIPLLSGSYPVDAWLIAMLTRVFNGLQARRGGAPFPPIPPLGAHESRDPLGLSPGERVSVLPLEEIARTLNSQSKNRGLWFDREMVKHCGREYRVLASVKRIVDDATGQMRIMKSPCITLESVDSTGEGLYFNAQHDPIFWRESWLRRID